MGDMDGNGQGDGVYLYALEQTAEGNGPITRTTTYAEVMGQWVV